MTGGLRRASHRDRDRLLGLWLGLMAHHASLDPHYRVRPDSESEWRSFVAKLIASDEAVVFVWEEGAELLGFCTVRIETAPPFLVERSRAEILDLMVAPKARRRGIGRALVDAGADWIRRQGVARTIVSVAAHNAGAQAFWRELGFGDFVDVLQRRG